MQITFDILKHQPRCESQCTALNSQVHAHPPLRASPPDTQPLHTKTGLPRIQEFKNSRIKGVFASTEDVSAPTPHLLVPTEHLLVLALKFVVLALDLRVLAPSLLALTLDLLVLALDIFVLAPDLLILAKGLLVLPPNHLVLAQNYLVPVLAPFVLTANLPDHDTRPSCPDSLYLWNNLEKK